MPIVNPEILSWARETAGLSREEAVEKLSIGAARGVSAVDRLAAIERGDQPPSRPLLAKIAKHYRRPLVTFYLSAPPRKGNRGQDFRTLPEGHPPAADALLDVLIRDIQARQAMVRSVLEDEEERQPLPFISSARMAAGTAPIVRSIREVLNVDRAGYRAQPSAENAFTYLRRAAEASGIFVLLVGNLGSHHTTIDLETFRGFALADTIAPFVVINDQDAHAAWSFTLLHELAHLWLGTTGVSGARADAAIEQFCNNVAGDFLVSADEIQNLEIRNRTAFEIASDKITTFANENNLSRSMVAYRVHQAGFISRETWLRLSGLFRAQWLQNRVERRERDRHIEGGPNYYVVRRHRLGDALLEFARRTLSEGALTPTKAGKVLGVKPRSVDPLIGGVRAAIERLA